MIVYQNGTGIDLVGMFRDIKTIRRANAATIIRERFENDFEKAAEAIGTQASFVRRLVRADASGARDIGEVLARKLERLAERPENWLDFDHEQLGGGAFALLERYTSSPPDIQALIRLALDDPDMPLPKSIRPSLKTMLEGVRMAIAGQLAERDE